MSDEPGVIYLMTVSLDGYVTDADGDFRWSEPDEEVHRFFNEQLREAGAEICGRRLYEVMSVWDTMDESTLSEHEAEFSQIWSETPKVVFSHTLDSVGPNARLAEGEIAEEVARTREETAGPLAVGGPDLAAQFISLDLIDEFRPVVVPVAIGSGTPFFPAGQRLDLDLVEAREFDSGYVYLRYRRAG